MAKEKGLNRSAAIRKAFEELPGAKAKEIVAHLKGKNIEVSEQLVYQVRKMGRKKKPGRKPGTQVKPAPTPAKIAAAPSTNGKLGLGASITLVKSTAGKVGGLAALKEIVDALA